MQKYLDEWVENKAVYTYVTQSGCACCGLSVSVNLNEFYAQCSDVEASKEGVSSWPPVITEQVWADRVKYRRVLKRRNHEYKEFWKQYGDAFRDWWSSVVSIDEKRAFCTWSEADMHKFMNGDVFDFNDSSKVVFHAVMEQIENFHWTRYPPDGLTDAEVAFEMNLRLSDGKWYMEDEYWDCGEDVGFMTRIQQMGASNLLSAPRTHDGDESVADAAVVSREDAEEDDSTVDTNELPDSVLPKRKVQSFKADRRLIRLTVCRRFIDNAIHAFKEHNGEQS